MPRLLASLALALLALASTTTASAAAEPERPTVVVLGAAGLRWADLERGEGLTDFLDGAAVGSLVTRSVRTYSCPADGWLALGAGNRAADALPENGCRPLSEPGEDGLVPRWDVYVAERDGASYGSQLGLLGALLAEHGRSALAVGPGAAIALATPEGAVSRHVPLPEEPAELGELVAGALGVEDLLVVDLGTVSATQPLVRRTEVAAVTARAEAVLARLDGRRHPVLLASLADAGRRPRLQVLAARDLPGLSSEPARTVLQSGSTRQAGYVLATDLLPTLLEALDLAGAAPAGALVGAPVRAVAAPADRAAAMVDLDRHATAIRALTPGFFTVLIIVNVALYGAAWLWGLRPVFRLLGVVAAALPVATFLANLAPWWRAGGWGLYGAIGLALALVAGLALGGPWRRRPLGPLSVVAAVTAATIILDVLTGSTLQLGSPMGVHPLVAGRFYGLNNSAFSLLMVSSLLVAGVAGMWIAGRWGRGRALALVAAIGAVVTVVDGMPGLGSDFGGPPAIVPAFTVLGLLVAGVRVGVRRMALVLLGGVVVVTVFSVADWLRPPASRTHLGRFVQTVLDGGLLDVITRKAGQNVTILTSSWLVLLVAAGVALVVWLVARPREPQAPRDRGLLRQALAAMPGLRVTLPAATTGLAIGFAVNDSGVVIPAIGMSLAVPLVLATLARWRVQRAAEAAGRLRSG